MVLVHEATNLPVVKGDSVTDFRGEVSVVDDWQPPMHAASSGRVYVRHEGNDYARGYFPSVFGLKFVEAV